MGGVEIYDFLNLYHILKKYLNHLKSIFWFIFIYGGDAFVREGLINWNKKKSNFH